MTPRLRLLALGAGVAACAAAVAVLAPHSPSALSHAAAGLGVLAPLVVLAAWTLLTPALFPGTVLAGATGLALGTGAGTAVSVVGALVGSVAAFLVARHGGGGAATRLGGPRVHALRERLERRGLVAVLVARAAPGIPATGLNYAAGLSRIRLRDFAIGIALGGTPRVVAYALLGGSLLHPTSPTGLTGFALLAVMTLAVPAILWLSRRRLGLTSAPARD
jgi:uncharacterized membrane protein YdjX (TVP38/TMEM64 family)